MKPNYFLNYAFVSHPKKEMIDLVIESIKEKKLFQTLVPHNTDDGNNDIYWGVDEDVGGEDSDDLAIRVWDHSVELRFDSLGYFPYVAYEEMTQKGFKISAMYYEPGMKLAGHWIDGMQHHFDFNFEDELESLAELDMVKELDKEFGIFANLENQKEMDSE